MTITLNGTTGVVTPADTVTTITSPAATALTIQSAGTTAMTIDTSQNVGIGTTSLISANRLSVVGGGIQLSGGTTAQAGLRIQATSGVATISGINNDNNAYNPIAFYTGASEAMRIDSSGNLLVGTASAVGRITSKTTTTDNTTYPIYLQNSAGSTVGFFRSDGNFNTGALSASPYNNTTASAANMFVSSSGDILRSTSSLRYKDHVQDASHGLAELMQLRSVTYKGKKDGDTVFGGLIAEEVHAAGLTEFVQYAEDGSPDALAYGNMVSLCIKAIQELSAKNDALEAANAAFEVRLAALEAK